MEATEKKRNEVGDLAQSSMRAVDNRGDSVKPKKDTRVITNQELYAPTYQAIGGMVKAAPQALAQAYPLTAQALLSGRDEANAMYAKGNVAGAIGRSAGAGLDGIMRFGMDTLNSAGQAIGSGLTHSGQWMANTAAPVVNAASRFVGGMAGMDTQGINIGQPAAPAAAKTASSGQAMTTGDARMLQRQTPGAEPQFSAPQPVAQPAQQPAVQAISVAPTDPVARSNWDMASQGMNIVKSVDGAGRVTYSNTGGPNPFIGDTFQTKDGPKTGSQIETQRLAQDAAMAKEGSIRVARQNAAMETSLAAMQQLANQGLPPAARYDVAAKQAIAKQYADQAAQLEGAPAREADAKVKEANARTAVTQAEGAERTNANMAKANAIAQQLVSDDTMPAEERIKKRQMIADLTGAKPTQYEFIKASRGKDADGAELGDTIYRANPATGSVEEARGGAMAAPKVMPIADLKQLMAEEGISKDKALELLKKNGITLGE